VFYRAFTDNTENNQLPLDMFRNDHIALS